MMNKLACRFCDTELRESFADLGMSPFSNAYLDPEKLESMEPFYPLHAYVCSQCFLVQLNQFESPEKMFDDYAYFSSYSESWLEHSRNYTSQMVERFNLTSSSQVVELASNDGYLLQYFVDRKIPVLGVEPAANVAKVAIGKGVPTEVVFFGADAAKALLNKGHGADLLLGNNVLAHVPDLNSFVEGMSILLKSDGVITMEFPHLLRLMEENQFDTIYHEHFSYLSFLAVEKVFKKHGLVMFDVDQLPTHGGSLRIYARHEANTGREVQENVLKLREQEREANLHEIATYRAFSNQVKETKWRVLEFLIETKRSGKSVVGYGAAAKGNTLLNYCGVRTDLIDYVVDRSPHKQNRFLPGTHIPIKAPERIAETKPDYVFILPWNLRSEISEQMASIREWGGKFVVPIPEIEVF